MKVVSTLFLLVLLTVQASQYDLIRSESVQTRLLDGSEKPHHPPPHKENGETGTEEKGSNGENGSEGGDYADQAGDSSYGEHSEGEGDEDSEGDADEESEGDGEDFSEKGYDGTNSNSYSVNSYNENVSENSSSGSNGGDSVTQTGNGGTSSKGFLNKGSSSGIGFALVVAAVAAGGLIAAFAVRKRKAIALDHPLKGSLNKRMALFSHHARHDAVQRPPRGQAEIDDGYVRAEDV